MASFLTPGENRKRIGIVTGSGPEAGVDLWTKVLQANKRFLGSDFRGDLDAPPVAIISEPRLGLSMEVEQYQDEVWSCLEKTVTRLAPLVNYYAIACNTLNCFQERLEQLQLSARLVSFADVVSEYVRRAQLNRLCLLGARPVMTLGKWSAYRSLPAIVDVEVPSDPAALHQLIYDIKTFGAEHHGIRSRFEAILNGIESRVVFLACTELPLVADVATDKELIDVTELVAIKLVELSFDGNTG